MRWAVSALLCVLPSVATAQLAGPPAGASCTAVCAAVTGRNATDAPRVEEMVQRVEADPWFGPDKAKHFFLTAFIQGVAYAGLRSADVEHGPALLGASVVSLGFGVAKEVADRRDGRQVSARDLVWDALGAAAASALLARTRR